jgi:hypothetical protein
MGRNTKIKLAALATTLVATVGIVAAGPTASADAGKAPANTSQFRGIDTCC